MICYKDITFCSMSLCCGNSKCMRNVKNINLEELEQAQLPLSIANLYPDCEDYVVVADDEWFLPLAKQPKIEQK